MRHILMIAYTNYSRDSRIKREAETLAGEAGNRVTLFTIKEGEKARNYEKGCVSVRESRLTKYQGDSFIVYIAAYVVFTILTFWQCLTMLVRGRLDVVHVHNMPNFLIFGALPARLRGGKIILDVHDTMPETYAAKFEEGKGKLLLKLLKLEESICTRLADAVIAVNEPQARVLVNRGVPEKKITVLMNVPDDRVYDYSSRVAGTQPQERERGGAYRTVYHGTVARRNGVDLAIRSVVGLRDRIPGIELTILGFGDYMEECRRLVDELDAAQYVFFPGEMVSEKVAGALQGMDLEIVTNRLNPASELMLPVKLMECIALGLPVVTARLPTIEHYFSDDMVYFFEPENPDSLVETIFEAYSNKEATRKKVNNAKSFLEKYGWNTHKEELFNLYQKLGSN